MSCQAGVRFSVTLTTCLVTHKKMKHTEGDSKVVFASRFIATVIDVYHFRSRTYFTLRHISKARL